ncbi:methanogen output domain 1-containing protein [Stieleria sp. ICT_E10.1]|uniref:methanogen output domain 1-containing protein n=1 Tax=Stieleria sedimenti TaxID=2976331 RepID=UPI00217F623F|nr:methanogen output domain 1-containing protein [Stieleria sedimenti]MCS7468794.1 methanogen output domain 1-containing protein [Stieleria sedimenti]
MSHQPELPVINQLPIDLARGNFMRTLLRELSGTLQDVVGLDQASGFVAVVGQRMGERINEMYRAASGGDKFNAQQVGEVLVDLKRRIKGDFYIVSQDDEKIVLGNRRCPFGDNVLDRPALCMMTSNVFGMITAENLGYAKVEIQEAIARGDAGCRVVVYLQQSPESRSADGREYFSDELGQGANVDT